MAERILQLLPATATAAQVADACRGQARADLAALRPKRALALLDAAVAMVAATLAVGDANALGSCYRRRGDIERALEILHQGLHAQQATDVLSAASLHLNLHAALSKLGQHGDALDQASAALIILQEELVSTVNLPMQQQLVDRARLLADGLQLDPSLAPAQVAAEAARRLAEGEEAHLEGQIQKLAQLGQHDEVRRLRLAQKQARDRHRAASAASPTVLAELTRLCGVFGLDVEGGAAAAAQPEAADGEGLQAEWLSAKVTLLAIAYHASAVEQELLKRHDQAVQSYIDAHNVARTRLGREHALTAVLATSRDAAARNNPRSQQSRQLAAEVRRDLRAIFKSNRLTLTEEFAQFDTNKDGAIDEREFRRGLTRLNIGLSEQQVEDLLAVIDRDGSGAIEYGEFEEMFGDANAGQLAASMTEQWGSTEGIHKLSHRLEVSQTLATEATLIAGRWSAPTADGVGAWPEELNTLLVREESAEAEHQEFYSEAELEPEPEPAAATVHKLDWSEASLHNLLHFDASLALPRSTAQELARLKPQPEPTPEEPEQSNVVAPSMLELPTEISGRSGWEETRVTETDDERKARQHAKISAPWKDMTFWMAAAKEEAADRRRRMSRKSQASRECYDESCVRNPHATSPYIRKMEETQQARSIAESRASAARESERAEDRETVQEHHVAEAFELMQMVRQALSMAGATLGEADPAVLFHVRCNHCLACVLSGNRDRSRRHAGPLGLRFLSVHRC